MGEVIEGEATEVISSDTRVALRPPTTTLAHVQSGVGQIMQLSDEDFERNLTMLKKGLERARRMQTEILRPDIDFGTLPGVDRPFLHKPGAETFEKAYGLATTYTVTRNIGDGENEPEVEYIVHARVHLGTGDGPVIAEGLGQASTWEKKYRYRAGSRKCPKCGADAIRRGTKRGSDEPEFYCWTKQGGCGVRFAIDTPELAQAPDDIENPDPWDLANTLLKMARKRSYVDGILTGTGTSGLFTQDEDSPAARVGAGAAGPTDSGVSTAKGPGRWTGEVVKIDPETLVRQVKVKWHADGGAKVHEKVEVKAKVPGTGSVTAIALDQMALAVSAAGLGIGEHVSFDGPIVERVWQEGKPTIKEVQQLGGLWRYRNNEWVPIGPAPAAAEPTAPPAPLQQELPPPPTEPDYATAVLEEEAAILDAISEPTWQQKVAQLKPMLVRSEDRYRRTGYIAEPLTLATEAGAPAVRGKLAVPNEGIYEIASREPLTVGFLDERGAVRFAPGDLVQLDGIGFISQRGTHFIVVHAVGPAS